jgi:hypothetical protein
VSGDNYTFHYSYETCNPVNTETLEIKSSDPSDSIFLKLAGSATTYILKNDKKYVPASYGVTHSISNISAMTEDTGCSLVVSKPKVQDKRSAASRTSTLEYILNSTLEKDKP